MSSAPQRKWPWLLGAGAVVAALGTFAMALKLGQEPAGKPIDPNPNQKAHEDRVVAPPPAQADPLNEPPTGSARGVVHTALAGTKAPMQFIGLTGGDFTMGSPNKEADRDTDEGPRHRVQLSPFEIGETEVSLAQYEFVTGKRPNDCERVGCDDQHPVTSVSWQDVVRFSNALTRRENENNDGPDLTECYDETTWEWRRGCTGYRLPTEAEWEYAARAGTTTPWSFGADAKNICTYANVDSVWGCDDGHSLLAPVGTSTLQSNPWGLHEVHGNVSEWVFDVYASYGKESVRDPVAVSDSDNDATNDGRVVRDTGLVGGPPTGRSANRYGNWPEGQFVYLGFRCARGAVPQP